MEQLIELLWHKAKRDERKYSGMLYFLLEAHQRRWDIQTFVRIQPYIAYAIYDEVEESRPLLESLGIEQIPALYEQGLLPE